MESKTKIMVFRMREVIYTGILIALAVVLVILLILMFRPEKKTASTPVTEPTGESSLETYTPGIYTTTITLGDQTMDVAVTVDEHHINAIRFVNLSESVTAMYPLMQSVLEDLSDQICEKQSVEGICCSPESQYTSELLLNAIQKALETAKTAGAAK